MNISAINCTPIKPQAQTSFKSDRTLTQEDCLDLIKQIGDDSMPDKKGKVATLISIATAVAVTFIGAKFVAAKAFDLFPTAPDKIYNGLKKVANKAKAKFGEFATSDKPLKKFVGEKGGKVENEARNLFKKIKGDKEPKEALKTLFGLGSMATVAPKVATVDGNEDGTPDIAQSKVNAYKNALKSVEGLSDIIEAFS